MHKDDLFDLIETKEVKNNPELHKELHTLWKNTYYTITSWDLSDLSINVHEYLLNNGITADELLTAALNLFPGKEKRDQLIDLALNHEIDWYSISSYSLRSASFTEAEKFLDKGASGKLILDTALEQEAGEKRDQLIDLALNHEIDWYSISSYNLKSLSTIEAEKLLDKGASGKLILDTALEQEAGEKRDQLIDLALTKELDWNSFYYYDLTSISTTEAEKFLNHGLNAKLILETAFYQDSGETRDQLMDLALNHEIDWYNISSYSIKSLSIIEAKKFLNKGASGKLILDAALEQETGEKRDQLIDLSLTKELNWNNFHSYNLKSLSTIEAEKFLDKGASGKLILDAALEQETGENRDQLIDLALNHEIDWYSISSYSLRSASITEAEKFLNHGASTKLILETALEQETGEKRNQLIELALTKKIDWNNFYLSSSISKNQLELFLNNGLPLNKALSSLLKSSYAYNETISKEVQHQIELIEFLVEKGASLRYAYSVSSSFPYETYKYLLEHGLNANHLLSKVFEIELGERHDQLLDLALKYKITPSNIGSIRNNLSKADLDKIIDSGLNPTKFVELTSGDNFIELFDYLTEKEIDVSNLQKIPNNLSYEQYQEILKQGINPDLLLLVATRSLYRYGISVKEKSIELIKLALDHGADINADYGNGNIIFAMMDTMDTEIIDFLVEHGAKCSNKAFEEIVENSLSNILFNPQSTIDQKFKNLDSPKAEEAKIPYILHQIWLTSPESPKEIREQDLKISLETHETFAKAPVQWQQIVWTNDKTLFPKTVKVLEDNGVQVKSIYEHQDELASFEMIENLISQQKWGMASDALRYVLVNEFGGVYADLNFNFHRHTTDEAHKYNYFTQEFSGYYIDNFFFAASPNHPIIQKIVGMVERNIVNPPEYIANIKDQTSTKITDMSTANPTFIAYYLEANKDGNIDVVYPKGVYPNRDGFYELMSYQSMDNNPEMNRGSERYEEIIEKYCPDSIWMMNLGDHPHPFDNICVAERFIIGEDSKDGKTWFSE